MLTCSFQDLAFAHYQATFAPGVGNQRILVTRGSNSNQEIADLVREAVPEWDERIPLGKPGNYTLGSDLFQADNTKSKQLLGMTYRSLEETVGDTARNFHALEKTLGQD